jgi:putative spermidine/putrescine transport system ATP-binding protein
MTTTYAAELPGVAGQASLRATTAEPLVRFSGVQKTYDGTQLVIRQLDLAIRRGEFLTLLGPSGSGKTTALMMLAGFESPTAGEILLNGKPITRTPPHKRNFGMVFQNYALFPHLRVDANVAYPLSVRGVSKAAQAEKVARALAMVRLQGMAERYPSQLSGGQQQRVALARALVFEPQLVLMDEPLGALDKQLREHMQLELKELHRQLGVTFVFVTHDQGEALTMSDRVAVFNNGVIQQIDAADRMYETPANRFVAGFIGDGTMLPGTVRTTDAGSGRCTVALADGREIVGLNVNGAAAGAQVVAGIRPERIAVHAGSDPGRANTIGAQVRDLVYFGDHLRLMCKVGELGEATVKMSLGAPARPRPGDALWLELPPDLTRVYA